MWPVTSLQLKQGVHACPNVTVVMTAYLGSSLSCPQCEFLNSEEQSPGVYSPSSLRVAACDLQQLMTTFSHVYETDLRAYCGRDPPGFSAEADVFRRVHRLLLALTTVRRRRALTRTCEKCVSTQA